MKVPLAHTVRPMTLDQYVGQDKLVGKTGPIRALYESQAALPSMIFWGPPGCGKTTLARILAKNHEFVELSAVNAGKEDILRVVNKAKLTHQSIVLFLDEIHRFNKAQQDALLPHVERGTIILIGATTENPSFEVNSALLSRCRVFVLEPLTTQHLVMIVKHALEHVSKIAEDSVIEFIAQQANGDARNALNILDMSITLAGQGPITKDLAQSASHTFLRYDKHGEEHYNIISALHKSMRDSDPQGATYWTMRMVEAGEDPNYIIRRMIRFASEDIGNADPRALILATSALSAVQMLGYPECNTALVQTAVYLALAPKSNAVYVAANRAREDIAKTGNLPVPLVIRNAPTKLMKDLNYGAGYKYAHDAPDAKVDNQHLPDELVGKKYYEPIRGFEEKWKEKKTE